MSARFFQAISPETTTEGELNLSHALRIHIEKSRRHISISITKYLRINFQDDEQGNAQKFKSFGNWSIDKLRSRTMSQQAPTELPSTPTKKPNPYHFVKLHAPWHVLCTYAEELHMYAPVKVTLLSYLIM